MSDKEEIKNIKVGEEYDVVLSYCIKKNGKNIKWVDIEGKVFRLNNKHIAFKSTKTEDPEGELFFDENMDLYFDFYIEEENEKTAVCRLGTKRMGNPCRIKITRKIARIASPKSFLF